MSWKSGSELAGKLWALIDNIDMDEDNKAYLAINFIKTFEEFDCDTTYECKDLMAAAFNNPDYLKEYVKDYVEIDELINLENYGIDIKDSLKAYKEVNCIK